VVYNLPRLMALKPPRSMTISAATATTFENG
jgi:hypothetical protein